MARRRQSVERESAMMAHDDDLDSDDSDTLRLFQPATPRERASYALLAALQRAERNDGKVFFIKYIIFFV